MSRITIGTLLQAQQLPGFTGSQGDLGYSGSVGYTGSQGIPGEAAAIGYTGSQGAQGSLGYTGSQGQQGTEGYTGSQGLQGIAGVDGYTGSQGLIGYSGSQGTTGYAGSQGIPGEFAALGYTGSQGIAGDLGASGATGPIGYTGSAGTGGEGGGTVVLTKTMEYTGELVTFTGTKRWWINGEYNISRLLAYVITAPTGANISLNVNKNASNVATINIQANTTSTISSANISITQGDYITVDVTEIGTTVPGSDLSLIFEYS